MEVYNVLVRLLDGKTATLKFSSPVISGESIKKNLYKITEIPPQYQRLVTGSRQINEETLITVPDIGGFSTVDLLLRLRGGKGGFGSLLRGAATKAGQKKTNNFDACRDMSGRRLRHVNAEKKLEEWKAEAEERKLEKVAEDFIKKKAKAVKKAGSGESEKYIAKYKEDSAKCMEDVEAAVRASFALHKDSKRKMLPTSGSSSKRFKLWSDKEDDDESDSDDEDDERSVVLDDGTHALKIKDGEGSSGSASVEHSDGVDSGLAVKIKDVVGNMTSSPVSGGHSDGESSGGGSSNLEEENVIVNHGNTEEGKGSSYGESYDEGVCDLVAKSSNCEQMASETHIDPKVGLAETESEICKETCHSANVLSLGSVEDSENGQTVVEDTVLIPKKPLNFDDINSAIELEGLGMEQLKYELQARGLKCGGTLRERAARLFLLKTTPLEMLPKKLLAKK